jgi:hypothetical protein
MSTIAEWKAMQCANYLQHHSEEVITAIELFPGLLDTFSEEGIVEELEAAGAQIRERVREFLAGHRPTTFRPFIFGAVALTPEEAANKWERERRRKYAALLIALGVNEPKAKMGI